MVRSAADKNSEWIYIVRPDIENLRIICKQINSDIKLSNISKYPYKILFAPRKVNHNHNYTYFCIIIIKNYFFKLFACDLIFEKEGVYEYVQLDELENDLIQLDSDLLSMEFPKFFSNYFLVNFVYIFFFSIIINNSHLNSLEINHGFQVLLNL